MIIFRSFGGTAVFEGFDVSANWSFGSIGYPKNYCSKNMIDWVNSPDSVRLDFTCQGKTSVQEVLSSGIISYQSEADYKGLVMVFGSCYYDPTNPFEADLFPFMQAGNFNSEVFNQNLLS